MCVCVFVRERYCLYVIVSACMKEKDRERERERLFYVFEREWYMKENGEKESVCVRAHVCVCEREGVIVLFVCFN